MRANTFTVLHHTARSRPSFFLTERTSVFYRASWPLAGRFSSYQSSNLSTVHRQLSFQNHSPHCFYPCNRGLGPTLALRRCYNSENSFPDPSRSDIFYHFFSPPTHLSPILPVYALSFLPTRPPSADSCTIIGWLPAAAEREDQEAGLSDFKENGLDQLSRLLCGFISINAYLQANFVHFYTKQLALVSETT
jgi:hypothetical protein